MLVSLFSIFTAVSARDDCSGGFNWDVLWGGNRGGFCSDGSCDTWELNGQADDATVKHVLENLPAGNPFAGRSLVSKATNLIHYRKLMANNRVYLPRECSAQLNFQCACSERWDQLQVLPIIQNRCRSTRAGRSLSDFDGCDCVDWQCTCQGMSDTYGTNHGITWGSAPQNARDWWMANSCSTSPASACSDWGCTCQGMSDTYGTNAGVTWGSAPQNARNWWISNSCTTYPSSACSQWGCTCQGMSDTFGTDAGITWGSAVGDQQTWWIVKNCNTRPARHETRRRLAQALGELSDESGDADGMNAPGPLAEAYQQLEAQEYHLLIAMMNAHDGLNQAPSGGFTPQQLP